MQPRWDRPTGISAGEPAFASIREAIEAAVVGVGVIAEHSFNVSRDELTEAGQRLAGSLKRLQKSVEAFAVHPAQHRESLEGGLEEAKLLTTIEKWQRRFQDMEEENAVLARTNLRLHEANEEVSQRLEQTIMAIDTLLEEEWDDAEA